MRTNSGMDTATATRQHLDAAPERRGRWRHLRRLTPCLPGLRGAAPDSPDRGQRRHGLRTAALPASCRHSAILWVRAASPFHAYAQLVSATPRAPLPRSMFGFIRLRATAPATCAHNNPAHLLAHLLLIAYSRFIRGFFTLLPIPAPITRVYSMLASPSRMVRFISPWRTPHTSDLCLPLPAYILPALPARRVHFTSLLWFALPRTFCAVLPRWTACAACRCNGVRPAGHHC